MEKFITTDRDREIIKFSLIIADCIIFFEKEIKKRTSNIPPFAEEWALDSHIAEWAEKIIGEWFNNAFDETDFTRYVNQRLNEEQKEFDTGRDNQKSIYSDISIMFFDVIEKVWYVDALKIGADKYVVIAKIDNSENIEYIASAQ